jgi:hypothetical protein
MSKQREICIDLLMYVNLLNLPAVICIFNTYGKLDLGTFNVYKKCFHDGGSTTMFEYPSSVNKKQAVQLTESIANKLSKITFATLVTDLINKDVSLKGI